MSAKKPLAIAAVSAPSRAGSGYVEPFKTRMGERVRYKLGDVFGLTQFGVNLMVLEPGAQSALRHHHTHEDEFVYLLEGELVLITDAGEEPLRPGMCVGFRGGDTDAHHLINRSSARATFVEVGSRIAEDRGVYPDDDLAWKDVGGELQQHHKDGTPY
jgi:uncharacterized cupin superfamily protein